MRMTTEEAFVKVLQMHGIEHAFGIIGSAMMPVSMLFSVSVAPGSTAPLPSRTVPRTTAVSNWA